MATQAEKGGRAAFWLLTTVLMTGVGFALGGLTVYLHGSTDDTAGPPSAAKELDKVVALGRIQPADGVLTIGVPTPDRIDKIEVREGQHVTKGQELVVLDSKKMRGLDAEAAAIQLNAARDRLSALTESGDKQINVQELRNEEAEQMAGPELEAQETKIEFLKQQKKNAEKDKERMDRSGGFADQDKEKQQLLIDQSRAELVAAESLKKKMVKSQGFNKQLGQAQLKAAKADLAEKQSAISIKSLEIQVKQAGQRVEDARIRAPSDGTILSLLAHDGELIGVGQPVLRMANTARMVVIAEVYETDIQRVRKGQPATITSHVFPEGSGEELHGKVVSKAASVARSQVVDIDPRAAVDNRIVEVTIELEQPQRVAQMIGHQVRVRIDAPQ
jgi:HlyD family secretion protein